jgi:hypothetical protein
MFRRIPHPSPALVVALVALFVALSGTAVAATIVAHAKLADNATKLQGKSAAQVAQLAPAPASLGGYLTVKSAPWSLNAGQASNFTAVCDAGQKAISGGFDNPQGFGFNVDTRPTPDGGGWQILMVNASNTAGASGSIYAVCLR